MRKFLLLMLAMFVGVSVSFGQAISVNGGSIQGTITDASGAALPHVAVSITSPETGYSKSLETDSSGFYSVGPLNPGPYTVHVTAANFEGLDVKTVVRTGTVTTGTFKLTVGKSSETVEVNAGAIQVNTEQISVSDVLTHDQLNSLPVNGRNFLDVAQIEPGVILQQGSSFDPTKAGYSAISVSGVSGRTTRILLDGQDITDEFVGTTILNVSQGSISEFQLNRSTQDVSGDVTSTGQVLVSTSSGTNKVHGQVFYNFQDYRALFASQSPGVAISNSQFQRNQYGGSIGGPILRDKLFFFANAERIQQRQAAASKLGSVFSTGTGPNGGANLNALFPTYGSPYKETYEVARLDYNGPLGGHYFVRGAYNFNGSISNFGNNFQLYNNRDNTYGVSGGADFSSGKFTHSFRGSYEKFHNFIADDTIGNNGIYNPIPSLTLRYTAQGLFTGPNVDAPQGTFQSDKQFRYDGTWTHGAHIFKFGGSVNRIQSAAFAAFYGLAPRDTITLGTLATGSATNANGTPNTANPSALGCGGVVNGPTCPGDPVNGYITSTLTVGNGQGFSTEIPAFGLNGGGGAAWRAAGYAADSYKVTPNLTMSAGLRWSVDTNRENNDLQPPTCANLGTALAGLTGSQAPCGTQASTTSLFTLYNPSFTGPTRQPYGNFAPQIGLNYSPGDHKTSFRAGFGLFFESVVFNNTSNARSNLLQKGAFYQAKAVCSSFSVTFPDGSVHTTSPDGTSLQALCQQRTVAQAAPQFVALQNAYQANTVANSAVANGGYVGNTLNAAGLYAPNYHTPYSEQWNFGVQRELMRGAVLSVDYVHNTTLKIGQTLDLNHQGAARNFNLANANGAVTAALAYCNVASTAPTQANIAIALGPTGCNPTPAAGATAVHRAAALSDFTTRGLDSSAVYASSNNYVYQGKAAVGAGAGAFPGLNQNLGSGAFIQPIGRSGYDALQAVYRQQKSHPFRYTDSANIQVSYSYSRVVSTAGGGTSDEFFTNAVYDNDQPTRYIGRSGLDRTHQLSFGGSITFKYFPRTSLVGHFTSAAPGTLTLDTQLANGGIFQTDVTGDGTVGDIAPGTNPGYYMHEIKGNNLGAFINNFNSTQAGKLTPAGQAVVNSGLFTAAQFASLGGAVQPLSTLPQSTALNNPAFRSMDAAFSYPIGHGLFRFVPESISIEPGIAFYNVGNFSNFGNQTTTLYNTNSAGTVNSALGGNGVTGTNSFGVLSSIRTTRGTGTFDQGAPRSTEFQLKVNF